MDTDTTYTPPAGEQSPAPRDKQIAALRFPAAADVWVLLLLLVCALVIAWPILAGGYLTYVDNPVHLAEVYSLAFEARNGWSDVAFCGFPIASLHSPLWYGGIAALVRIGVPAAFLYTLFVFVGFVMPPALLYLVTRRRLQPVAAGLLAWVLLVQQPSVVGLGAPLAGMWTFYIAAGAFIVLVDRLVTRGASRTDLLWIACLVAFIVFTHIFLVAVMIFVAIIHIVAAWRRRVGGVVLLRQLGAGMLGVIAGAVYWMPTLLTLGDVFVVLQHLHPIAVVARLFMSTDVIVLFQRRPPDLSIVWLIETIPMLLLAAGGFAGALMARRRRDDVPLYGMWLAAALIVIVGLVVPITDTKLLGPVSWRLLYFVRIGFALAAVPVLLELQPRLEIFVKRLAPITVAVLMMFLAFPLGSTLRTVTPRSDGRDMSQLKNVWQWLATNSSEHWGRVYLQDTFMTPPANREFVRSHALALTAHFTGVRQLGAWYGISPYKTGASTKSEFGMMFERFVVQKDQVGWLLERLRHTNVTHVVTSEPGMAAMLTATPDFEQMYASGRFAVLRIRGAESQWVAPVDGDANVDVAQYETGRIRFRLGQDYGGETLIARVAYHAFWRINGAPEARLTSESTGLTHIENLEAGAHDIELVYRAPRWPRWISLVAGLGIAALAIPRRR